MKITKHEFARAFECGRLEPYIGDEGYIELCEAAKSHSFGGVFCHLSMLDLVVKELEGHSSKAMVTIDFPLGSSSPETKIFEAKQAVEMGAQSADMVMSLQRFKSGDYQYVEDDIRGVVEAVGKIPIKVIIEACYWSKEELVKAAELCSNAGAMYIKTSTGWGSYDAPRYHARLVDIMYLQNWKEKTGNTIGLKAAGHCDDLFTCIEMYKAGATLFGANAETATKTIDDFEAVYGNEVEL